MLLYAFQDPSFQWHGDAGTPTLDGRPGSGWFVYHATFAGVSSAFAGQRLLGLYGPCELESSSIEVQLEDGVRLFLTWNVAELLQCGPRTGNRRLSAPTDHNVVPPASTAGIQPRQHRAPAATRQLESRRTGPWTLEEDRQCHAAIGNGTPLEALAQQLQRSVKAVRFHLPTLGLADFPRDLLPGRDHVLPGPRVERDPNSHRAQVTAQQPRAYQRWTPEEESILLQLHSEGLTVTEIVTALERQTSAVRDRLGLLDPSTRAAAYRPLPAWDDDDPLAG